MSRRRRFPWDKLGIDETDDTGAIRKAYADALRATNVDEDIAGYAELRRARDQALWLAAERRRQAERQTVAGEAEKDDGSDLGLGDLAATGPQGDDGWFESEDDLWDEDDASWHDGPPAYCPASLAPEPDPELSAAQAEAQVAWGRMLDILYPEGEASEEAVTLAEMEEGLAALAILTARAESADLAEHDALDGALAELFARTWPRSAPFVAPAAEAFHWLDESGSLEERPALRFLNQRLKGMRFHEKVQQADHPLNKAWAELVRPGRVRLADRLRVKRLDVHKLLNGIRQNFPELESHLDDERVASWEQRSLIERSGGIGPFIVRGMVLAFIGVIVLGFIADLIAPRDAGAPPLIAVERRLTEAELDAKVRDIFGTGVTMARVRAEDPKFARDLEVAANKPDIIPPLDYVRMQALASAEIAPRPALVSRAALKAIWLSAARSQGGEACRKLIDGKVGDAALKLSSEDRAREQDLLRQLLDAKVLSHMPKGGETRYAIPGWLVGETIKRSGLSAEKLAAALGNPDSPDRCAAETGLAQAVSAAPGKVPDEVLKGL